MNKQVEKKVPLDRERFKEARKLRKITLEAIGSHPSIERTKKTLLQWINKKEIPKDKLDAIGKILNVDPQYLSGEFDRIAERIETDPEECQNLKARLHANDFPYINKKKREQMPLQYIFDLLIDNNIEPEELDKLSHEEFIRFYLEIEKANRTILSKYFKPHHSSLSEYSMPMPSDEEIINQ